MACFKTEKEFKIPILSSGHNSLCPNYTEPITQTGNQYNISIMKKGWGQPHCIPIILNYPTHWVEYWDHGICGEHLWLVQWGEKRQSGGYNTGGNCASSPFYSVYDSNFVVDHECTVSETWEYLGETLYSYDFLQLVALEFSDEAGHAIYPSDLPMPNRIRMAGNLSITGTNPYGQTSNAVMYLDGRSPDGETQIIQETPIPLGEFEIDLDDPLAGMFFAAFVINTIIYGGTYMQLEIDIIEMWW